MVDIKVMHNVISDEDCNIIIDYLDNNNNTPDFPQLRFKNNAKFRKTFVDPYSDEIKTIILKYANILSPGSDYYVAEYFLSLFEKGYEMHMHKDIYEDIEFTHSVVMYLNDDFEGGNLVIPDLNFIHSPKKGDVVMFSPVETDHYVSMITSGKRYTAPFWFTNNPKFKSKFLY